MALQRTEFWTSGDDTGNGILVGRRPFEEGDPPEVWTASDGTTYDTVSFQLDADNGTHILKVRVTRHSLHTAATTDAHPARVSQAHGGPETEQ